MRPLLSGLMLLAMFSGCARYQSFRVLDAQTRQPLDGVQTERLEGSIQLSPMPFVLLDSLSPVERKNSDASGTVKFGKRGKKFAFNPQSGNPGFDRAYVVGTWSGAKILYPDQMNEVHVKAVDGVVEVPLHRSTSPQERSTAGSLRGRPSLSDSSHALTGFESPLK